MFADFAAWALQIAQLLLSAFVVIGIGLLLWTLWQPSTAHCDGSQAFLSPPYAPIGLVCQVDSHQPHFPHLGGR